MDFNCNGYECEIMDGEIYIGSKSATSDSFVLSCSLDELEEADKAEALSIRAQIDNAWNRVMRLYQKYMK